MSSEAILLSFRIYPSACAWLATILDRSPVISIVPFWIIFTWSNNLVSSSVMVSDSDCTQYAHVLCYSNEWAITCSWLRTFPHRSNIPIWQASRSLVIAISYSNALAFPVDHCLIYSSIFALSIVLFLLELFVYYYEMFGVYFCNTFRFITHHHHQLFCWRFHHSLLLFRNQPNLSLLRTWR